MNRAASVQTGRRTRRKSSAVVAALAVLGLSAASLSAKDEQAHFALFENGRFEQSNLQNWTAEGKAFEGGPTPKGVVPEADGTGSVKKELRQNWKRTPGLYTQPPLSGCDGKAFANSFHPQLLNRATGSLTSIPFVIQKDYLSFQLAGGRATCPGAFAVNLIADGKIVRQGIPKGKEFSRCSFDVRALKGRKAQIRIYDEQVLHGGWIAAGGFAGTDAPTADWIVDEEIPIVRRVSEKRTFTCDQRYLNIPATRKFPDDAVKLVVDGRVVQEICMSVCDEKDAEFWQFIDLSLWQGKNATLTMTGWSASKNPLAGAVLDDHIRGLDNLYDEKYRPQFHFTPIQGWNNDVNGTVYYDGEYHLFYQYDPSRGGNIGRNMHWGHAVSKDLFHWKHLPIALGVDPQRGQNYSGSAVVDFNNVAGFQKGSQKTLIAFYTRRKPYMFLVHDFDVDSSDQCMAYSTDRGRTWTHVDKPAVRGITGKNRDPKVFWHEESGKWIMAFAIRNGYDFYSSDNLKDWKRESRAKGGNDCPDIFKLEVDGDPEKVKWIIVNGGGACAIGDFDGKQFSIEARTRAVYGPFSATQTFNNTSDDGKRRIQMSWFHFSPRGLPCRQMISLPVELTLRTTDEGVRMFANPAREIASLRTEERTYPDTDLSKGPLKITDLPWELTDMALTLGLKGAKQLNMSVWGHGMSYDTESRTLNLGRSKVKVKPKDGRVKLRVLVDRCSVDVCANDGRAFLMDGMYPDRNKPAFECSAEGGAAAVKHITFHRLKSIWHKR